MELDLAALDTTKGSNDGHEVQLVHIKTNDPLPIWIEILGTDSETYQEALRAQQRRRMDQLKRGKRMNLTPEELEEESIELLALVTRGWRSDMKLDGQPFPAFSKAAAKQIYKRFRWIREQVDAALGDRTNFLPRSAAS